MDVATYGVIMCNLDSITKGQAAIIAFTRAMRDTTATCRSAIWRTSVRTGAGSR